MKIEKLRNPYVRGNEGCSVSMIDLLEKINEIIDAMNGEHDPADIYSEDGRLIAKKDESEDERIRKEIIDIVEAYRANCVYEGTHRFDDCLAYLEKQKEEEGYEAIPIENTLEYKAGKHAGFLEGLEQGRKQKEQKPITESKRLANEVIEYLIRCGYSPVLKDDSKKEHFHIDIPRHEDDFWHSEEYKHCRSVLGEYYMEGDYGGDTYTLYIWRVKKEQKPNYCHYGGDPIIERCRYCSAACSVRLTEEQKPVEQKSTESIYDKEVLEENLEKIENMTVKEIRQGLRDGYGFFIFGDSHWAILESDKAKRDIQCNPVECSEKHIAEVFEKVGLAKIVREEGNDELTNAVQSAMIELGKPVRPAEWSEFDNGVLKDAITSADILGNDEDFKKGNPNLAKAFRIAKCWLKELPLRFNLQPKPEWSEEDEDMLNCCISSIEASKENRYAYKETDGDTSYDREIDWLKSLRPSWKPSEEQLEAMEFVIKDYREDGCIATANYLQEILDQIKKL